MAAIFSWRSPSARPLSLDPATTSDDRLLELMLKEPRLIKRPIVDTPSRLLVGFDAAVLGETFGAG